MRASHVIKGASSNLMCEQLRKTSTDLEQTAAGANGIAMEDKAALDIATEKVKKEYAQLKTAVDDYRDFVDKIEEYAE